MTAIQVPKSRQTAGKSAERAKENSMRLGMLAALAIVAGIAWFFQPGRAAELTKAEIPAAITGQASIIDADTLEIHGERIRLEGIDAPESGQRCYSASNKLYRCGAGAANALDKWIGDATVTCRIDGTDRYSRLLGTCQARGVDMQEWLVENGYALAYRQYSTQYVAAEQRAASAKAGIWEGRFVNPAEWRKGLRMEGEKPTKAMREGKFGLAPLPQS